MFLAKNLSHSEMTWLCDYFCSTPKSIPFRGDLTMWFNFPVQNLSHSEGTWLCDYNFQPKIYHILSGPDYVIILPSQKSIPFWGDLNAWLYFAVKNLSHSEETCLCDYIFSQKSIPLWGDLTMWLYPKKWNPSHSERTWLCDCILGFEIYSILRGPDYVITPSSQKSIPFWGDLTMWLYFPAKNLSQSEWTWPSNYTSQPKIYPILRGTWICDNTFLPKIKNLTNPSGPHYKIILSSQKYIPFWGDLTMWLCFQPKIYPILRWHDYVIIFVPPRSLYRSEGTWLCDLIFQFKIYPILRGPDYVIIISSQKFITSWVDLTM